MSAVPACRYTRARTVEEAIASLEESGGEAHVFAGGVALGILMNSRLVTPSWIVDIARIERLRGIHAVDGGALRIGALATHAEIERSTLIAKAAPLLNEMAREIACGRIRNRGTIGGNLCLADPQSDPPAALLALGASLGVRGPAGARAIAIDDFFRDTFTTALAEAEILESIEVPAPHPNAGFAFAKFGARRAMDYAATVSAAVAVVREGAGGTIAEARIGMGGVGKTPVRALAAEAALRGTPGDTGALAAMRDSLAAELDPVGDLTFSADYKRHVAAVMLERAVARALARAGRGER